MIDPIIQTIKEFFSKTIVTANIYPVNGIVQSLNRTTIINGEIMRQGSILIPAKIEGFLKIKTSC